MGVQPASLRTEGPRLSWAMPLLPVALAVFMLSALAYYHIEVRGAGMSSDGLLQGAVVLVYDLLGFVPSFMLSLLVLIWASIWFISGKLVHPFKRAVRILAFGLSLALVVNLGPDAAANQQGGVIGSFLASRLVSVFGYSISTLLAAGAALASVLLATDFFFYRYFESLSRQNAGLPWQPPEPKVEAGVEPEAVEELRTLSFAVPDQVLEREAGHEPAEVPGFGSGAASATAVAEAPDFEAPDIESVVEDMDDDIDMGSSSRMVLEEDPMDFAFGRSRTEPEPPVEAGAATGSALAEAEVDEAEVDEVVAEAEAAAAEAAAAEAEEAEVELGEPPVAEDVEETDEVPEAEPEPEAEDRQVWMPQPLVPATPASSGGLADEGLADEETAPEHLAEELADDELADEELPDEIEEVEEAAVEEAVDPGEDEAWPPEGSLLSAAIVDEALPADEVEDEAETSERAEEDLGDDEEYEEEAEDETDEGEEYEEEDEAEEEEDYEEEDAAEDDEEYEEEEEEEEEAAEDDDEYEEEEYEEEDSDEEGDSEEDDETEYEEEDEPELEDEPGTELATGESEDIEDGVDLNEAEDAGEQDVAGEFEVALAALETSSDSSETPTEESVLTDEPTMPAVAWDGTPMPVPEDAEAADGSDQIQLDETQAGEAEAGEAEADEPVDEATGLPPGRQQGELFESVAENPELLAEAAALVAQNRRVTPSFLQRRLRVAFAEAVELLDAVREQGLTEGGSADLTGEGDEAEAAAG